jgi:L-alanine-DL-glutamate epimerase-like enolase superfamily enzyme
MLDDLERLGVVLIEQPFPARRLDLLAWLQARSPLPIVADESSVTADDLDALVGVVAGVNVKLAKVGGVGPAKRMLERALAMGFRTFLGCMEETSIVIAASAAVSPLAEWVDLDGCLLLADDPVTGLSIGEDKVWRLPDQPGLGLVLRPDARP